MAMIQEENSAIVGQEHLDDQKRLMERLVFNLRLNEGVNIQEIEKQYQCSLGCEKEKILQGLVKEDFLVFEGGKLRTTQLGKLLLDEISERLI